MKDRNAARKAQIRGRAKRLGNSRVAGYLDDLEDKMDVAGEACGAWLEGLEGSFEEETSEGLFEGFSEEDLDGLFWVLFGYKRK